MENFRKVVFILDYVIRNNKNVYIRLGDKGKPVTCVESAKMTFEHSKALNILDNLPKTLKKLNFKVEAIPDIEQKNKTTQVEKTVIHKEYTPPESVTRWIEKFGVCDDVIQEARDRKEELIAALSNTDKELSNTLHKIELGKSKNACEGFKEYKELKSILDKRRNIKDELMIISSVLHMDFKSFDGEIISKAVAGLAKRKFTMRFVEEDDTENVV